MPQKSISIIYISSIMLRQKTLEIQNVMTVKRALKKSQKSLDLK
jgi:hypothetical protein